MVVGPALQLRIWRVAIVGIDAPLLHIGKESLQRIEVLLRDWVILVIMTLGAGEGRAKPGTRDGANALPAILGEILLGLCAAFARHHIQAVEPGGHQLLRGRIGQEIARELLQRELIEWLVRRERINDVIAIREDALVLIAVEAHRVCESCYVEPPHGHAFAVVG